MRLPPVASSKCRSRSQDETVPFSPARRRLSDPTLRRLVRRLLAARVRAGLTQEQVARKLGTKKSAISRLESGAANRPTLTTIENYALVVGCRVEISLHPFP